MSLVHDALEKAKREASAKTARELGLPDASLGAGQPFRARRRPHPAAAAGAAALATLAIVAAAFLFSREKATEGAATAAVPHPTPPVAERSELAPTAPTAAVEVTVPPISSTQPAKPSAVEAPVAGTVPAPPAARKPEGIVATAPAASVKAPASPPLDHTPTFRRQVTLDDGSVIKLGGIAWSEEAPLAYLNGKLYVRGESVAGMRVERIEKERVLLVGGDGRRLYLTLR